MKIERNFLTINKFSRPGNKLNSVKGVVIHWVANPGTSAVMNRNYFDNLKNQNHNHGKRYASAHFIIGLTGEVIQCLPVDEWAYHVGAKKYVKGIETRLSSYPNNCTLGIELCHESWSGRFNEYTWNSAVELTATLLKQFSLNPDKDIYRHFDITNKICPKFFVENSTEWERFISDVKKFLIGIL